MAVAEAATVIESSFGDDSFLDCAFVTRVSSIKECAVGGT